MQRSRKPVRLIVLISYKALRFRIEFPGPVDGEVRCGDEHGIKKEGMQIIRELTTKGMIVNKLD